MIVPRLLTPVPLDGLDVALDAAHRDLRGFGRTPDAYRLAIAQFRLEHGTANGSLRGLFCFNFGNHDATAAERNDPSVSLFVTVPEHEEDVHGRGYSATHVRRAYEDAESGLIGYWTTLLDGFPDAYDALDDGPEAFAAALKRGVRGAYYTAAEGAYARALRALGAPEVSGEG